MDNVKVLMQAPGRQGSSEGRLELCPSLSPQCLASAERWVQDMGDPCCLGLPTSCSGLGEAALWGLSDHI